MFRGFVGFHGVSTGLGSSGFLVGGLFFYVPSVKRFGRGWLRILEFWDAVVQEFRSLGFRVQKKNT